MIKTGIYILKKTASVAAGIGVFIINVGAKIAVEQIDAKNNKMLVYFNPYSESDSHTVAWMHVSWLEKHAAPLAEPLKEALETLKEQQRVVTFTYKNYRGEVSQRMVILVEGGLRFGTSEFHTEPQWLLKAYCCDRKDFREFALCDIQGIDKA